MVQERPGGDYEISSDSLWALRGETLVRSDCSPAVTCFPCIKAVAAKQDRGPSVPLLRKASLACSLGFNSCCV